MEKSFQKNRSLSESTTVGIDVGIKDFAVLSTGEKVENPKYLKNSLKRLKVLQKRVSRKQKGSKNRAKAKQRLAVLHDKITNQRNDFQNKFSFKLVSENQAIALETLNVKGMVKNHHLAQAISDSAWSSFVTKLEYKAEWLGKTILRIGQFEPSSKLCSVCGYHNKELQLKDRAISRLAKPALTSLVSVPATLDKGIPVFSEIFGVATFSFVHKTSII